MPPGALLEVLFFLLFLPDSTDRLKFMGIGFVGGGAKVHGHVIISWS